MLQTNRIWNEETKLPTRKQQSFKVRSDNPASKTEIKSNQNGRADQKLAELTEHKDPNTQGKREAAKKYCYWCHHSKSNNWITKLKLPKTRDIWLIRNILLRNLRLPSDVILFSLWVRMRKNERKMMVIEGLPCLATGWLSEL